jgi:hypothetical protein
MSTSRLIENHPSCHIKEYAYLNGKRCDIFVANVNQSAFNKYRKTRI